MEVLILFRPMVSQPQLEWVKPPLQARSARTLGRILDSAEVLIAERGADGTTVAEVARRARSSVGAFYARFPDKEALLRCVFERFMEQAVATADAVLQPDRWDGVALERLLETSIAFTVRVFRERRALIAAFAVRAAADPQYGALGVRIGLLIVDRMHALLARRGHLARHPAPREAIGFAVWLLLSALEARCLYVPPDEPPGFEAQIAPQMARMCVSYLGLDPCP
jgi:AcrR family transcriptional regulator